MEEPRRIALIDILASDDDFSYIENANLEEMEEEIKKLYLFIMMGKCGCDDSYP